MVKELQSKMIEQLNAAKVPSMVQSLVLDVLEKFDFRSETEKVAEFRTMMNQPNIALVSSNTVSDEDVYPILAMLFEEYMELVRACGTENLICMLAIMQATCKEIYDEMPAKKDYENEIKLDEIMDAIVDMRYHLANLSLSTGLHEIEAEAFNIVHDNNMTKATQDPNQLEDIQEKYKVTASREKAGVQDFYVYKCEHDPKGIIPRGKVLKPIDYISVNLGKFIREAIKSALPILLILVMFGCEKPVIEVTEKVCTTFSCDAELDGEVIHHYHFTEKQLPHRITSVEMATEKYNHLLQNVWTFGQDTAYCYCD